MSNFFLKTHINKIALFGNPVNHSLSPKIHSFFSKNNNIKYIYIKILSKEKYIFSDLKNFFLDGGLGANITAPFKEKIFSFPDTLKNSSLISNSINTLTKNSKHDIIGSSTDGKGLVYDLIRLNFLKSNNYVLIIGSGGSASSIIYSLLLKGCIIRVFNRTLKNAIKIVKRFILFGNIKIYEEKVDIYFNLIINTTSCGLFGECPYFPLSLVNKNTCVYDISYTKDGSLTPFLNKCKEIGVIKYSHGIGMLVAQAAYSFFSWFNFLPNIINAINYIINNDN